MDAADVRRNRGLVRDLLIRIPDIEDGNKGFYFEDPRYIVIPVVYALLLVSWFILWKKVGKVSNLGKMVPEGVDLRGYSSSSCRNNVRINS